MKLFMKLRNYLVFRLKVHFLSNSCTQITNHWIHLCIYFIFEEKQGGSGKTSNHFFEIFSKLPLGLHWSPDCFPWGVLMGNWEQHSVRAAGAVRNLLLVPFQSKPAQHRELKMSCELREFDWNVRVLRALWSSHRRDFCSRGLFWQRSPAVWNLQLHLVMSNHTLDWEKFLSLLGSWDISREYCSEAKVFFLNTNVLLKSIYLCARIGLLCELWSPFGGMSATYLNLK